MEIRPATPADARDLAFLVDQAGEGLPRYLWGLAHGGGLRGDALLAYGAERAMREDEDFSYRNARVAVVDAKIAGMLLGYRLSSPYDLTKGLSLPEVVRPLVELEALVPGSWYINAIATYERFRGQGVASALLSEAVRLARDSGADRLSLIVKSENQTAGMLYRKLGFETLARRPMEPYPGGRLRSEWLLMLKPLEAGRSDSTSAQANVEF
ncbi:N-acetyltransferase [Motiliproteus sp. SC1-56]|uniref:GNAT family N-acetyltransferase n=1 Tax=Motiliproteus sp. SC1-56 TaxID=2799565 RepID=UPI001A8FDE3B|nr:N-acetyltransferase [Motiliproteus sp. SC1-56]